MFADISLNPLRVKVLEEKIPLSYDQLRQFIETYQGRSPAIHKDEFLYVRRESIRTCMHSCASLQCQYLRLHCIYIIKSVSYFWKRGGVEEC